MFTSGSITTGYARSSLVSHSISGAIEYVYLPPISSVLEEAPTSSPFKMTVNSSLCSPSASSITGLPIFRRMFPSSSAKAMLPSSPSTGSRPTQLSSISYSTVCTGLAFSVMNSVRMYDVSTYLMLILLSSSWYTTSVDNPSGNLSSMSFSSSLPLLLFSGCDTNADVSTILGKPHEIYVFSSSSYLTSSSALVDAANCTRTSPAVVRYPVIFPSLSLIGISVLSISSHFPSDR